MSESDFLNKSKIFGSGKQLTKYQEAINEASYSLCKNDGSLLMNKGKLLQLAREKVHNDGYNYAKRVSRSQVFGTTEKKAKRAYVRQEVREARIIELSEGISSQVETIKFLQQQKVKYSNTEKFLEAAEINKSILEESKKKRKFELELEKMKAKKARSVKQKSSSQNKITLGDSTEGDTDVIESSDEESLSQTSRDPSPPPLTRCNAATPEEFRALYSSSSLQSLRNDSVDTTISVEQSNKSLSSGDNKSQGSDCDTGRAFNDEPTFLA